MTQTFSAVCATCLSVATIAWELLDGMTLAFHQHLENIRHIFVGFCAGTFLME